MEAQESSSPAKPPSTPRRRRDAADHPVTAPTIGQSRGSETISDSPNWFSLMMKEYDYLQGAIDKLDGQRFQIRNWTVLAAGALFTASLSAKIPLIALGGVITTLFFAFLEVIYMQMLDDVIKRNNQLENLISNYRNTGEEPMGYVFGVGQAFVGTFGFKKIPHIIFNRNRIHVTAFYIGLMVVTAAGGLAVTFQ